MRWFKKEEVIVEPVVENEATEIEMVEVKDIKQYLVNEYERSKKLEQRIEKYEEKEVQHRELKMKYDASLLTLNEYEGRINRKEENIKKGRNREESLINENQELKNELNIYKIKLQNVKTTKEEVKAEFNGEVINDFRNKLIEKVSALKGHISKDMVVSVIENLEV